MSLGAHIQELRKKHQALELQVEEAHRSLSVDDIEIRAMKKEKLRIKEEISRLEA